MIYSEGSGTLGALNATVTVTNPDMAEWLGVQVTGTFVATAVFQFSNDGTNWTTVAAKDLASGTGALVTSVTAAAFVQLDIRGVKYVRASCSAYTSGTINVAWVLEREF